MCWAFWENIRPNSLSDISRRITGGVHRRTFWFYQYSALIRMTQMMNWISKYSLQWIELVYQGCINGRANLNSTDKKIKRIYSAFTTSMCVCQNVIGATEAARMTDLNVSELESEWMFKYSGLAWPGGTEQSCAWEGWQSNLNLILIQRNAQFWFVQC